MDTMHLPREKIRGFIRHRLDAKDDTAPFDDSDLLRTHGRLDSLDTIELMLFLEKEFGLDFATTGFDRENVDSVDAIVKLLKPLDLHG